MALNMTKEQPAVIAPAAFMYFLGDGELKREDFLCLSKKLACQLVDGSRQRLRPMQLNQAGRNRVGRKFERIAPCPSFLSSSRASAVAPHLVE